MTRKAKERRQERVLEKQRARERRAQREQALSSRADWRALLRRIDGEDAAAQAVVSPRHRQQPASDEEAPKREAAAAAVPENVQWKSTHVPVAAASVFQLPIKVEAPHATLAYEFSTRDFDITFAIHAIGASDGAAHELVSAARYESHRQPVRGALELAGPAMALLVWDNTYSWLNAKQLAYTVELRQAFPAAPVSEPVVTPEQRAALALHERAKRERLRTHREAARAELDATMASHDRQAELLQHQIEELRRALESTEAQKQQAAREKDAAEKAIDALAWEIDALLWRSIGATVIEKIFSFCDERDLSTWSLASHQWHARVRSFREIRARAPSLNDGTTAV